MPGGGWLSLAEGSSHGEGAEVPFFDTSFAVHLLCVWYWKRGSFIPKPAVYGAECCRTPRRCPAAGILVKGLTGRDWSQSAGKTLSFVLLNLSSGGALYSGSFLVDPVLRGSFCELTLIMVLYVFCPFPPCPVVLFVVGLRGG